MKLKIPVMIAALLAATLILAPLASAQCPGGVCQVPSKAATFSYSTAVPACQGVACVAPSYAAPAYVVVAAPAYAAPRFYVAPSYATPRRPLLYRLSHPFRIFSSAGLSCR